MDTTSNTTSNKNDSKDQEVGALWKRKSKNGVTYLAGHVKVEDELGMEKTLKVVMFSNKNKLNENQPDFRMYLSKANSQQSNDSSTQQEEAQSEQTEQQEAEEVLL